MRGIRTLCIKLTLLDVFELYIVCFLRLFYHFAWKLVQRRINLKCGSVEDGP